MLNGTGITGLAAGTAEQLSGSGFDVGAVLDAPQPAEESVVLFVSDAKREARVTGRELEVEELEPVGSKVEAVAGGAEVVVMLGSDEAETAP